MSGVIVTTNPTQSVLISVFIRIKTNHNNEIDHYLFLHSWLQTPSPTKIRRLCTITILASAIGWTGILSTYTCIQFLDTDLRQLNIHKLENYRQCSDKWWRHLSEGRLTRALSLRSDHNWLWGRLRRVRCLRFTRWKLRGHEFELTWGNILLRFLSMDISLPLMHHIIQNQLNQFESQPKQQSTKKLKNNAKPTTMISTVFIIII